MDRSTALRCLLNLGLGRSRSRPAQVIDPKGCKTHHSNRRAVIRKHVSEEPTLPTISTTVENPKNLTERRRLVLIKGASS